MLDLTQHLTCMSKVKAIILDKRQRIADRNTPNWFMEQCEALGLFTTQIPAFAQLFFYKFNEQEKYVVQTS